MAVIQQFLQIKFSTELSTMDTFAPKKGRLFISPVSVVSVSVSCYAIPIFAPKTLHKTFIFIYIYI